MKRLRIREVKVVNCSDIDTCVRDAFGKEHVLFPQETKTIKIIVETAHKRLLVPGEIQQEK